jgi:heptosyltransferase-1
MRVLLIKTSSMGDVLHALPALTDAMHAIPGIRFDWVVEEAFQEIPSWHPAVDRVIPVALRRWRRHPLQALWSGEWNAFKRALKNRAYDVVLDSQGLIKSAWIARKARGLRIGFDSISARESIASRFYEKTFSVDKNQHAIARQRQIFASALSYRVPDVFPDSHLLQFQSTKPRNQRLIFLPGTTWASKEWLESSWRELSKIAVSKGYSVEVVWGNSKERQAAARIVEGYGVVLPKMTLGQLAERISEAGGVVGVDSGLAHLAAALGVPAITLYGATDAAQTGAVGRHQENIQGRASCAPCMRRVCEYKGGDLEQQCWREVTPQRVWENLRGMFDA